MTSKLSKKQEEILDFLKSEIKSKGYPPSVRETCVAVGLSSTSTVHAHLKTLEKKGVIRRDPTKPRAIEIIKTEEENASGELIHVPIVGRVTAGVPILAVENIEGYFPIPITYANNKEIYMLNVLGDSMIKANILDGDLILVQEQPSANNGDIVVALLDDSVTVKRFFKENDFVRLQPENDSMNPIFVKDIEILGKVIGLFRTL
ncbi:MAG TPA: transcriptional repressor LexA [Epulopiscium sp.]|nr:transcriptional repressor LexA [Candidatus Epulonipiscium sp.]